MLVRFTPKQLSKIKEFLKTCTLKAYDIQIYNEIINALEHAIDEKPRQNIKSTNSENIKKSSFLNISESTSDVPLAKSNNVQQNDGLNITKKNKDTSLHTIIPNTDIEDAGIFTVIDRRTSK